MSEKITITFLPDNKSVETELGTLAMDAAVAANVGVGRSCGGAGVCGKCRVKYEGANPFEPVTLTEKNRLTEEELANGVRLSCCARLIKSGTLTVIDKVKSAGHSILEGFVRDVDTWTPACGGYGVAVDIGTTTVVCYLANLDEHKIIDRISFLNPQVKFGDDVISRIAYSEGGDEALATIRDTITSEMDKKISEMAERNAISASCINEIVIAANTVMEHLFAGVSPSSIGKSPYKPQFYLMPPFAASKLGFHISENGIIKMLANVAGYVGADIVAGVAAIDMDTEDKMRLMVDIGTNNEITAGSSRGMFCCATAAGPALEGARIGQGMRAATGAVEKVYVEDGELKCDVIGNADPIGICGSGLIDAIAMVIDEGLVNKSGRFISPEKCTDPRFKNRLSKGGDKPMVRLLLTDEAHPVYLTQKDIREVQLAVGAIKVGIQVMLEHLGITKEELDEVCIAGAFGNNIDIESAVKVGILPDVDRSKIRGIKNSSGLGACMALASRDFYEKSKGTAEKMKYIELSSLSDFQNRFVSAMSF